MVANSICICRTPEYRCLSLPVNILNNPELIFDLLIAPQTTESLHILSPQISNFLSSFFFLEPTLMRLDIEDGTLTSPRIRAQEVTTTILANVSCVIYLINEQ